MSARSRSPSFSMTAISRSRSSISTARARCTLRPVELLLLRDEGDLPIPLLLLAEPPALHLGPVELLALGRERDLPVPLLALAREGAPDLGRLAPFGVLEDSDGLRDPGLLHLLRGADLLALDLEPLFEDEPLLGGKDPGLLVRDLLVLARRGERLLLVEVEHREPGLERLRTDREARPLLRLVPDGAGRLLRLRHRGDPLDVGALALALLGRELDVAVLLRALARESTGDIRDLLLPRLLD